MEHTREEQLLWNALDEFRREWNQMSRDSFSSNIYEVLEDDRRDEILWLKGPSIFFLLERSFKALFMRKVPQIKNVRKFRHGVANIFANIPKKEQRFFEEAYADFCCTYPLLKKACASFKDFLMGLDGSEEKDGKEISLGFTKMRYLHQKEENTCLFPFLSEKGVEPLVVVKCMVEIGRICSYRLKGAIPPRYFRAEVLKTVSDHICVIAKDFSMRDENLNGYAFLKVACDVFNRSKWELRHSLESRNNALLHPKSREVFSKKEGLLMDRFLLNIAQYLAYYHHDIIHYIDYIARENLSITCQIKKNRSSNFGHLWTSIFPILCEFSDSKSTLNGQTKYIGNKEWNGDKEEYFCEAFLGRHVFRRVAIENSWKIRRSVSEARVEKWAFFRLGDSFFGLSEAEPREGIEGMQGMYSCFYVACKPQALCRIIDLMSTSDQMKSGAMLEVISQDEIPLEERRSIGGVLLNKDDGAFAGEINVEEYFFLEKSEVP